MLLSIIVLLSVYFIFDDNVYFIKSAVSTLDQLSRDPCLFHCVIFTVPVFSATINIRKILTFNFQ